MASSSRSRKMRGRGLPSCGSGVTACQLVLAAELVGRRAALYPGSYSQWCALGRPVATGAGRPGAEV